MKIYKVFPPSIDTSLSRFTFSANVNEVLFQFHFYVDNGELRCYVVIANDSVREVGVIPNVINWSRYLDYSLVFFSDYDTITLDTLSLSVIYVVVK